MLLLLSAATSLRAQQASPFPYPAIPQELTQSGERLAFLAERYWSCFAFDDTTAVNRATAEQGFVDFIDLLAVADSALCARSCQALADSMAVAPWRMEQFEQLMEHYLMDAASPMRDDRVLAHLLRALPPTEQRTFLLAQVSRNQVGSVADDIAVRDAAGRMLLLSDTEAPMTLLVFYDPDCERCHQLFDQMRSSDTLRHARCQGLQVLVVDVDATPDVHRHYYLPLLPALYLLDADRRVVQKDATLEQVEQRLR